MQWGQIKTLFILCFLLLDIYLLFLVLQKQGNEELGLIDYGEQDHHDQETLELENISIPENLPEVLSEEAFVTIKPKMLTEEELNQITANQNQEVVVVNNSFIISQLEESIIIPENATEETIAQFINNAVYLGNEYRFEYWDKDRNILVFFQEKNERPVYYNPNGTLLIYLNDNNEILAYTQSLLDTPEPISDEKPIIKPLTAIMRIFNSNLLLPNDVVTEVEIGYHSVFPDSGRQYLVPTWKISIQDRQDRFVNAIEQFVMPVNDNFIDEVLQLSIENIRTINDDEVFKKTMLELLNSKLKNSRSEST